MKRKSFSMVKKIAVLSMAAILLIGCTGCGSKKSHVRTITNVSYDPTREFYEAYNPLFEKYYQEKREKKWILFNPTEVPVHRHALLWKDAMPMSLHWHWSMISY